MGNNSIILEQITNNLDQYSKADRRIGEIILERPHEVVNMSIGKFSNIAGVSDPSIVRFCRSLGIEGFREFKLRLVKELAVGTYYVHREVSPDDSASEYINKIGRSTINVLSNVVNKLDHKQVELAVTALSNVDWIEFWGFGASAVVAADAYHKFFRLGVPCAHYSDSHMQSMSASVMTRRSAVVVISHTGRSRELIENVQIARESGAVVIGITTPDSPLAQQCSQVVAVDLDEDTNVYTPMNSRFSHLLVLDILVVGVSLQYGQQLTDRLKRMKRGLTSKKNRETGDR
ncbi:hypothetical protein SD71_20310 [Cohnella kolymensis]|uniref:Transcriptional regulator n=1 Tax=Cohnella kolymensis TaxID=1590652 RepID=A0ABR5A108_9BACL|nr:transcriptional regulator HexR [Cohnella kolymensis]KIL34373.1 hypothetical protein SD71_20310 [Cohnella kolymensis]